MPPITVFESTVLVALAWLGTIAYISISAHDQLRELRHEADVLSRKLEVTELMVKRLQRQLDGTAADDEVQKEIAALTVRKSLIGVGE